MEHKYGQIIAVQHDAESQNYGAEDHELGQGHTLQVCTDDTVQVFPADEPLFLLRGQDQLALNAVWHYYETLRKWPGMAEYANQAYAAWLQMAEWQKAHPERVKLPD